MSDFSPDSIRHNLQRALPAISGVPVADSERIAAQLSDYLAELHKWNRAYNLTAVRDPQSMLPRHIYDSLSALPWLRGPRVIDVGTGAGLPGLVLAVCRPDLAVTLLDSNGKKVRFLQHAVAVLGLPNVEVVQSRADQFVASQNYASVVCRAFTSLADFVRQCAHLRAADGVLLAMKGKYPADEVVALPPGWSMVAAHPVQVRELEGERHIIELQPSAI